MISSKKLLFLVIVSMSLNTYAQDDREAFKAAFDTCVSETGVTKPEKGSRPTDEDRAKIETCMSGKGFTKTEHGDSKREAFKVAIEACSSETGVTRPERGVRPSAEDMAKMDACLSAKGIEKHKRLAHRGGRSDGRPRHASQASAQ